MLEVLGIQILVGEEGDLMNDDDVWGTCEGAAMAKMVEFYKFKICGNLNLKWDFLLG